MAIAATPPAPPASPAVLPARPRSVALSPATKVSASSSVSPPQTAFPTLAASLSSASCGVLSGMLVTGLLNPWDRALYLSVTHRRAFLHRENFIRPYQGLSQTLVQRSLSTGLYFPLEDLFMSVFQSPVMAGQVAGLANGLLLNPLACVKYQIWGHCEPNRAFMQQARSMMRNGGAAVFFRGAPATCLRDSVFGATFSGLRRGRGARDSGQEGGRSAGERENAKESAGVDRNDAADLDSANHFKKSVAGPTNAGTDVVSLAVRAVMPAPGSAGNNFVVNMAAAAAGTVLSSPFNYLRNIQFARSAKKEAQTMPVIMQSLRDEVAAARGAFAKASIIQGRLRIGWGTLRVASGMAIGAHFYDMCKGSMDDSSIG